MGINSFDFNWLLKPGEEFNAPETVMVYSAHGLGEMSRTYHKLYRTRLCRGKYRDIERPILINNWEGTYFDFNEEKILNIAKTAKKAGVELMVLDDGWFGKRNDDRSSLGDWYVNKEKLPNGIGGLAKKINDLGMMFGLWFEPEMISPDSDLYREHPDWCLHVEGRERSEGRNQLILDLSREDVCDYIIDFMTDYLKNAPISYIKWDMNRNMTEIGSALLPPERQEETAHRYMLGLYKILEKLTSEFPDVLFEGCSGGGGRFDAGMLPYFVQYWTSDDTDAGMRMYIQHGTSMVMPSSTMGSHVSAVPNHQTGRTSSLKTRGAVAMCGQFGYELDVTQMTDEELSEIAQQIKEYKEIREVVHKGDMYRLESPFEGRNTVWEYVSEDKNTVVLFRFTTESLPAYRSVKEKFEGLEENALYVRRDNGEIYSGSVLMNCGILFKNQQDFDSEIVIFDKKCDE
ncbi:MAG: alpha-galactosidase [Clostridia bacterium]|nr:alpha-galactosidase [Clostridia bacterium]